MKRLLMMVALCASIALPVAAFGQAAPPGPGGPPSADQRAAMEKARTDAKAAAFAALTPAHATSVQAIILQVSAGTLDRRAAAGQIDALLGPDEQKAVLAAAEKSRRAMRFPPPPTGAGAPPPPGPGGPPPGPPGGGRFGPPSAGRFLLMVSMSRGQMRGTQPRARSSSAP